MSYSISESPRSARSESDSGASNLLLHHLPKLISGYNLLQRSPTPLDDEFSFNDEASRTTAEYEQYIRGLSVTTVSPTAIVLKNASSQTSPLRSTNQSTHFPSFDPNVIRPFIDSKELVRIVPYRRIKVGSNATAICTMLTANSHGQLVLHVRGARTIFGENKRDTRAFVLEWHEVSGSTLYILFLFFVFWITGFIHLIDRLISHRKATRGDSVRELYAI